MSNNLGNNFSTLQQKGWMFYYTSRSISIIFKKWVLILLLTHHATSSAIVLFLKLLLIVCCCCCCRVRYSVIKYLSWLEMWIDASSTSDTSVLGMSLALGLYLANVLCECDQWRQFVIAIRACIWQMFYVKFDQSRQFVIVFRDKTVGWSKCGTRHQHLMSH